MMEVRAGEAQPKRAAVTELVSGGVTVRSRKHFAQFVERSPELYKDIHRGLRVVIVGNGPSAEQYFGKHFDAVVMGVNRSWQYPIGPARYFATMNSSHFNDVFMGKHRPAPHTVFARASIRNRYRSLKHCRYGWYVVFVEQEGTSSPENFSVDLTQFVAHCFSGIFAIQVALYMGFSEIYLVGFDAHDGEGHAGADNSVTGRRSPQLPFYVPAAKVARERGQLIVNCNQDSAIRCFDFGEPPVRSLM